VPYWVRVKISKLKVQNFSEKFKIEKQACADRYRIDTFNCPKSRRRRKTASLYNGAKLRVWYKKNVSHRGLRGHREEISRCGAKGKEIVKKS